MVKDSTMNGNGYGLFNPLSPAAFIPKIQRRIDSLNKHFAPICVSFEVCDYQYIPNYWYLDLSTAPGYKKKFEEMRTLYNVKDRINLYYVQTIGSQYTYYIVDSIGAVNSGGLVLDDYTSVKNILQAMGTYFGLTTTYNIPGELVNGSNSSVTGDLITDTPADPYDGSQSQVTDAACKFIYMQKDANNQYYSPFVGNAMSHYLDNCLCNAPYAFTHEQYKKMAKTYLSNPGMW